MESRVRSAKDSVWRGFLGDGDAADIESNISSARSDSVTLGGRSGKGVHVGGRGEDERSFLGGGGIIEARGASFSFVLILSLVISSLGVSIGTASGSEGGVREIDFEARLVNSGEGSSVSPAESEAEDHSSSSAMWVSSCCCGTSSEIRF
jgi:hypothetical protein